MIHIVCPKCSDKLRFADDEAGQVVACPRCAKKLRLPARRPAAAAPPPGDADEDDDNIRPTNAARRRGAGKADEGEDDNIRVSSAKACELEEGVRDSRETSKMGRVVGRFPASASALAALRFVGPIFGMAGLACLAQLVKGLTGIKDLGAKDALPLLGMGALALLLGGIGVFCIVRARSLHGVEILLRRGGITILRRREETDYTWDDLPVVYRRITRRYVNGRFRGMSYQYTLTTSAGEELTLGDDISNIQDLGEAIVAEITKRQLSQARADYEAGKLIYIDEIGLSKKGLVCAEERLPWAQIRTVYAKDGHISIMKSGSREPWCQLDVADIPNVSVFLALVDEIRGPEEAGDGASPFQL